MKIGSPIQTKPKLPDKSVNNYSSPKKFSYFIIIKPPFMVIKLCIAMLLICSCHPVSAQSDSITGVWKGTSLCQVKNSPCHDEQVVYHISKESTAGTYTIQMNKTVNGVEEEMAALHCNYDPVKNTLTGTTTDRQGRKGVWEFTIKGDTIKGRLVIHDDTLYRLIDVKKSIQ
jgi:hypothetical protein